MNVFEAINNHFNTDPNSRKHVVIGSVGALIYAIIGGIFGDFGFFLVGALLGGLLTGIEIEIYQCIVRKRANLPQNTFKEAVLDALVTASWPFFMSNLTINKYMRILKTIIENSRR